MDDERRGGVAPAQPPAASPTARSGRIVGIDLGTTNSCVAVAERSGARVLVSRQGYTTIPSIVAFDGQGRLLVGHRAKAQMVVNPCDTVYGSKRLVGRPFGSPTVQACRDRFHYDIVEGPSGEAAVRFGGCVYTLQQVAALVLGELREMASAALGEEVTRAVVTVPAYYNDHQRQAVREAGLLAGLHVLRIVNEPTAAALAFGNGRSLDRRVLVYDLGGGTFDASVVEILGDVYEVVSTGGDTFLGGVDFDAALVDRLVQAFMEQHGFAPPDDRVVWQRLRDVAEETKVALSSRESVVVHVPFICKSPAGRDLELKLLVTRAELEALTGQLVDRTLGVCRDVLAQKGLSPGDVEDVLLVGGQSRMPLVRRRIREELGRDPARSVHPDEAVALGAALLGDADARIDSAVLLDVLPIGIGVGSQGGRMVPILQRNTRLPARGSYELPPVEDGRDVDLTVFQGDSEDVTRCEYLGTLKLGDLPPANGGAVKIAVEFSLGNEGILSISARDVTSGRVTSAQLAAVDSPESLREKLGLSTSAAEHREPGPSLHHGAGDGASPDLGSPAELGSRSAPMVDAPRRATLLGRIFGRRGRACGS
jgi:molecular chaperone DnaK